MHVANGVPFGSPLALTVVAIIFCRTTKGLLECPCTDRIVKVLPTAYKAQSVGVCAAAYRVTSAAECAAAVTRAALQLSSSIAVTSATGVTTSMPAGCCLSFDLYGALPSLAANRPYQPLPCTHLPLRCPVRCAFCIGSLLSSRYDGGAKRDAGMSAVCCEKQHALMPAPLLGGYYRFSANQLLALATSLFTDDVASC